MLGIRFVFLLFLLFNSAESFSQPHPMEINEMTLAVGSTSEFKLSSGKPVWIEHGKIIQGKAIGTRLVVKALQSGYSEMRIGQKIWRIHALSIANIELFNRLKKLTSGMIGLEVKLIDGLIVVSGNLYSLEDFDKLSQAHLPKSTYEIRAKISSNLQKSIQDKMNSLLHKNALNPQNLIFGESLEVETAAKGLNLKKFKEVFASYGVRVTEKNESIEINPLVKVEITVAEVRRDFSLSYGIEWPSSLSATVLPGLRLDSESQSAIGRMLEQSGEGKILANPSLLCRTGKEAEFLAGGEFPIQVGTGRQSRTIVWRKYGVLLKVKPLADRTGRMSIAIDTEVSTIDGSHMVEGIPGLLTNRISSHFDLRKPETIALSGLIKKDEGKSSVGIPGLSQIPILGALFSSKDFLSNQTELVIFVRPSIVQETVNNYEGEN